MKKIFFSVITAIMLTAGVANFEVGATEIKTYDAIAFQDENTKQYTYLLQKVYRDALFAKQIAQTEVAKYTHIQFGGKFYAKKEYRNFLFAEKEFKKAINALVAKGTEASDVNFVEGELQDGKVVAAQKEFKVIDIK